MGEERWGDNRSGCVQNVSQRVEGTWGRGGVTVRVRDVGVGDYGSLRGEWVQSCGLGPLARKAKQVPKQAGRMRGLRLLSFLVAAATSAWSQYPLAPWHLFQVDRDNRFVGAARVQQVWSIPVDEHARDQMTQPVLGKLGQRPAAAVVPQAEGRVGSTCGDESGGRRTGGRWDLGGGVGEDCAR